MGKLWDQWAKQSDRLEAELDKIEETIDSLDADVIHIDAEVEDLVGEWTASEYREALKIVKAFEKNREKIKQLAPKRTALLSKIKEFRKKSDAMEREFKELQAREPDQNS